MVHRQIDVPAAGGDDDGRRSFTHGARKIGGNGRDIAVFSSERAGRLTGPQPYGLNILKGGLGLLRHKGAGGDNGKKNRTHALRLPIISTSGDDEPGYHEILFGLLTLIIVLLIYGSLYPWHFASRQLDHTPVYILLHSWEVFEGRRFISDVVINIAIYVPLGMSAYLAFRRYRSSLIAVFAPIALAAILSGCVEMLQIFTPGRDCSTIDLIDNILGSALGVAAGVAFVRLTDFPLRPQYRLPDKVAVALLLTWGAWLLFPFYPALWLAIFRAKGHAFIHGPVFDPMRVLTAAAVWFSAGRLLQALDLRKTRIILAILLLLLPIQFGVAERFPVPSDWTGALLGVAAFWVFGLQNHSDRWAAGMLLIVVTAVGLFPFRFFDQRQKFYWMPFLGALNNNWQTSLNILLGKLYEYGAAIWLLTRSGVKLWRAAALVAVLLASIEAAQTFSPGHVAEITDPLLAVLLGIGFAVLRRFSSLRGTILRKA